MKKIIILVFFMLFMFSCGKQSVNNNNIEFDKSQESSKIQWSGNLDSKEKELSVWEDCKYEKISKEYDEINGKTLKYLKDSGDILFVSEKNIY